MIDLHTHILPAIDDGARTLDDALSMAELFVAEGITTVAATPHVRDDYPTSADMMLSAVGDLQRALESERIDLTVLPGAEIAMDWIPRLGSELPRLTLAGSGRYILVETPYDGWPAELVEQLLQLRRSGYVPVLGHPERNPQVQASPSLLAPLVSGGMLVQVTAASLDGRLGSRSQKTALELIVSGLAHLVASDAHTPEMRAAGTLSALEEIRDQALADWLTSGVPGALVKGESLPPRPPRQ